MNMMVVVTTVIKTDLGCIRSLRSFSLFTSTLNLTTRSFSRTMVPGSLPKLSRKASFECLPLSTTYSSYASLSSIAGNMGPKLNGPQNTINGSSSNSQTSTISARRCSTVLNKLPNAITWCSTLTKPCHQVIL